MVRNIIVLGILIALTGCLLVREEDLQSWQNQPVVLLDTHPFFITVPMIKTIAADGTEIRNYRNGRSVQNCSANSYSNSSAYVNCYQNDVVCNNIFYIKNDKVIRYAPTGRCYTAAFLQPQKMY